MSDFPFDPYSNDSWTSVEADELDGFFPPFVRNFLPMIEDEASSILDRMPQDALISDEMIDFSVDQIMQRMGVADNGYMGFDEPAVPAQTFGRARRLMPRDIIRILLLRDLQHHRRSHRHDRRHRPGGRPFYGGRY